jgi:hypothetical protein
MNTYQTLHSQHLLCYSPKGNVLLQMEPLVVDEIHHRLKGVALEVSAKLGQSPPNGPVCPLRLYFGRTLGFRSFRRFGSSGPLRTYLLFDLSRSQTLRPFWGRSSRRFPRFGYRGNIFRGTLMAATGDGPILSSAIPTESSNSMSISSNIC